MYHTAVRRGPVVGTLARILDPNSLDSTQGFARSAASGSRLCNMLPNPTGAFSADLQNSNTLRVLRPCAAAYWETIFVLLGLRVNHAYKRREMTFDQGGDGVSVTLKGAQNVNA